MRARERLRTHWQELHPQEYAAMQRWLGQEDLKVQAALVLARDGMKPAGAREYTPEGRENE